MVRIMMVIAVILVMMAIVIMMVLVMVRCWKVMVLSGSGVGDCDPLAVPDSDDDCYGFGDCSGSDDHRWLL